MYAYFEELLQWQGEIADAIVHTQEEISSYEALEKELYHRRDRAVIHASLGLKHEKKEIEYAIHYVQEKLSIKRKELQQLQGELENKIERIITHYRTQREEQKKPHMA